MPDPQQLQYWSFIVQTVHVGVVLIVALLAGYLTVWRLRIADSARRQERFRLAAELLDPNRSSYVSRVAGVVVMGQIADEDPAGYREPTARAFMAWLAYPATFGEGPYKGIVDYESAETVAIVEWLNERKLAGRYRGALLPHFAPFHVSPDGYVVPNAAHESCRYWIDQEIYKQYPRPIWKDYV